MIDIHTHILPNIDDGSQSLEASIQMVREAAAMGVRHLICTPHYEVHGRYAVTKEQMEVALARLQTAMAPLHVNLQLHLGHELYYHTSILERLRRGELRTLAESHYVLLEFSTTFWEYDLNEIIYAFGLYGYQIIVAHVERYAIYDEKNLRLFRTRGALFQINAETLLGSRSQRQALSLLKKDLVSFVSSDVHEHRPSRMKEAYELVQKKLGKAKAEQIFVVHPQRILDHQVWEIEWRGER